MHISHCRAHAIIGSMHLLEDALPIVHARYRPPEATATHFDEFPACGRILGKKFKSRTGKNFALCPIQPTSRVRYLQVGRALRTSASTARKLRVNATEVLMLAP